MQELQRIKSSESVSSRHKLKFLVIVLISLAASPVFAQSLSDRTGLSTSFDVQVDGKIFEIKTTANYDVQSVRFDDGRIIMQIKSSLENNIGEMQIPQNVTRGEIRFYLDGEEVPAKVLQNEKISFATLEFKGNGTHTLEIASDYTPQDEQPGETQVTPVEPNSSDQIITIAAVVGIVVAAGAASTLAVYFKRRTKTA